jgi:hypothetical protein
VTGWIILIVFLLAPLACWALLARTKILGWTFAIVFVAYAVAEGSQLQGGWPFRAEPAWLLIGLPVMTVVALVAGTILENRELGEADPGRGVRGQIGVLLASFYGIAVVGGAVLLLIVLGSLPTRPAMASPDLVTPLGSGLTVTQQEPDCPNGEDIPCTAEFQVRSTSGLRGQALVDLVQSRLMRLHGWPQDPSGYGLTGCRLISGHMVCLTIAADTRGVQISLDESTDANMPG